MINDVIPLIDAEAGYWTQMNDGSVVSCLKSATIISALAASVLASAYFAYTNFDKWVLATASVIVVNLYALPKILHYGNATMIKFALVANLIALSSLLLGGIGIASMHFGQRTLTALKTYDYRGALITSFIATGLLGYGVPLFREGLEKAYCFLQDPDLQERFEFLREQFHGRPEVGLGLMQGHLLESFLLHVALFKPQILLIFCQAFYITLPNYAWAIAAAASEKMDMGQFNHLIAELENVSNIVNLQGSLSDAQQASYHLSLKIALRSLKQDDLSVAISTLLSHAANLIPNVISNEQFLELFTEIALTSTNDSIEKFLELIDTWEDLSKKHDALSMDVKELEQDIQNQNLQQLTSDEEEAIIQRHEELQQQFTELRTEIEKIYLNKRIWQNFAPLWDNETDLPFEKSEDLLDILHDQSLLREIEDIYHSMIAPGQGANRTLIDRMQYIRNKLTTLHEDKEEEDLVSAVMYLAANKGFIQQNFEDLQKWLNLDSPHDLEDALTNIGLATEEDLYENEILPRQGTIPKDTILTNLRHFIEKAPQPQLADRIEPQKAMNKAASAYKIVKKVTRFIYYAITSGLILAPVLINPVVGGTSFVLGTCFFILKRFGFPGTQAVANFSYAFMHNPFLPFGEPTYRFLSRRRIFSVTPQRRRLANSFVNADFCARMRSINVEIFFSFTISYMCATVIFNESVGSFAQGIAIANEVVSLF